MSVSWPCRRSIKTAAVRPCLWSSGHPVLQSGTVQHAGWLTSKFKAPRRCTHPIQLWACNPAPLLAVALASFVTPLSGPFTRPIKTVTAMAPNAVENIADVPHVPDVHRHEEDKAAAAAAAAGLGGETRKPIFDKEKVTVILVLGGPGAGVSLLSVPTNPTLRFNSSSESVT
jgi:hypothetical protein